MPCSFQSRVKRILVGSCASAGSENDMSKPASSPTASPRRRYSMRSSCVSKDDRSTQCKSSLAAAPPGDPELEEREGDVERDAQSGEDQQPREHQRHVEVRA